MNDEPEKKILPPQLGAIAVGGPGGARPLKIGTLEDVQRLAKLVMASGLIPSTLNTPEKISIALLHGMEIGLPPMMSLQRIAVINNMPSLWGDGALALVEASGRLLYIDEYIEGGNLDDANTYAVCELHRKGKPKPIRRTYSIGDARRAGLLGKGPWKSNPGRMLQMRARGFALRDTFPDVLGGLYLHEEIEGEEAATPPQQMKDVTPIEEPEGPPPAPSAPPRAPPQEVITTDGEIIDAEYDKEIEDSLPPPPPFPGDLPVPSRLPVLAFDEMTEVLDDYSDSEQHLNDWRRIAEEYKPQIEPDDWDKLMISWTRKMDSFKAWR
jgi:hypothetical protein